MKSFHFRVFLCVCLNILFISFHASAQEEKYDSIQSQLKILAEQYPGLEERVQMNVADVNLSDFLNTIAIGNRLNISVDETLNFSITNNFSDVTVTDVLIFLCKKYDLDLKLIGSIIILTKHKAPVAPIIKPLPKTLNISYDSASDQLSLDLKKDTLYAVARQITISTERNIVVPQDLSNMVVSGYIQNQTLPVALSMLAYANNLKITTSPDGVFVFEKKEPEKQTGGNNKSFSTLGSKKGNRVVNGLDLKVENDLITLSATAVSIQDIIVAVTEKLNLNYFLFSELKGTVTLNLMNTTYEGLLSFLLNGTEYTYRKDNDIYLFGERSMEGLRSAKVIQLKFRTVDKLIDFIPAELKKGIEIKTFPDLNSLIASGSQPRITELQNFITDIDRVVPMVSIEVIILEVSNSSEVTKGITAGLSQTPVPTQGTIFPGLNLTLSSSSINNVIDKIGGLASLDLGHVTPSFYVTLQLLETNGHVKIKSTPKLSTLNGHSATISIGQTQYYLETQNTVVGTQNPQNITTQQYKSVNADLSVTINPMVAGDEQITMDIKVKQSTFTARISPTAPPGNATRNFESLIRVKNDDMILLGGLDEDDTNDTGSGVPGLARIPVLNWLFGNRDRSKSKDRLVVLVKPTILY